MFIHIWDTDDKSACERVVNRNLSGAEISYSSDTGNGFITDKYGNDFTFKKSPIKSSFSHPDFGDLKETVPTDWFSQLQSRRHRKPQPMSADAILNTL